MDALWLPNIPEFHNFPIHNLSFKFLDAIDEKCSRIRSSFHVQKTTVTVVYNLVNNKCFTKGFSSMIERDLRCYNMI